jgi:dTDP-4-dehydrorhamnose 3,5-epimerase-like enzyme
MIELPGNPEERRQVTYAEFERHVPFPVLRVYWIHGLEAGEVRGRHAHRVMQQVLVAVNGGFDIVLDDSKRKRAFRLEDAKSGLFVPAGLWRVITALDDASVLLSLSSTHFSEDDYIRDYEAFVRFASARA